MRVLVLGVSGMLGSAVFRAFDGQVAHEVWGLLRNESCVSYFSPPQQRRILIGVDVLDEVALSKAFERVRPDVVINCVGLPVLISSTLSLVCATAPGFSQDATMSSRRA